MLKTSVSPVLLGLAVDLHVSVAGFDFVEHSAERVRRLYVKNRPEDENHLLICPKANQRNQCMLLIQLVGLVSLTCHRSYRGRNWPMGEQSPPPPK